MTIQPLLDSPKVQVTNLISYLSDIGDYVDSGVVKAAIDLNGDLMYLTRSPIPFPKTRQGYVVHKQIGLYAFRRNFLFRFVQMPQTPLELVEGIEFLRILENGFKIRAVVTDYSAVSVDTLSDLIEVEKILRKKKS
jgi:CMP-2-keto-3-deoxyoctulosonic acid synthetase